MYIYLIIVNKINIKGLNVNFYMHIIFFFQLFFHYLFINITYYLLFIIIYFKHIYFFIYLINR